MSPLRREHGRKYSEPSDHWRLTIPHHRGRPLACLADHKILHTVVDGGAEFDATLLQSQSTSDGHLTIREAAKSCLEDFGPQPLSTDRGPTASSRCT